MATSKSPQPTTDGLSQSPKQATDISSSSSSPPTSLTFLSTNTTPPASVHATALPPLHETLPSPQTQRQIAEARAAVVASIGNLVDSELQSRATILHENAAALEKQEADVVRATEGLRREREKLVKEADSAARGLKEIGNVQNWAEVLERQFLVLEETVRLANGGDSDSGSGSGSECSCSDCGRDDDHAETADGEAMDIDEHGPALSQYGISVNESREGIEAAIRQALEDDLC